MTKPASIARLATPWSRWHVAVTEAAEATPLCLALANTRNWRNGAAPLEHLHGVAELLRWAERKSLIDAKEGARLETLARAKPRLAGAEFAATLALRESVYRVFSAQAHDRVPAEGDLAQIGAAFNAAVGALELMLVGGKLTPRSRKDAPGLEAVRLHVALSAVALLTSPLAARVKECADDRGCGWLFLDMTRNGSRRFCFSNECGNRARQVAFRQRHRTHDADRVLIARRH
jgi:predicted RNA-binding Zn ribbon-like protein